MKLLTEYQATFEKEIESYLQLKIQKAKEIDKQGAFLYEVIKEFIDYGGKRLRPALFFYAYTSITQKNISIIEKISCVFELFHTLALIHDDIIDNSDLRRNKPTVHTKYNIPVAILAGDVALMLADEIFFDHLYSVIQDETIRKDILTSYNKFKQEVLIGEYLDVIKSDDVDKIMELKTAEYSFIKPVEIGLKLAQAPQEVISQWQKILREVGLLFQIKDDVIGTFGSEIKIGKSVDSDLKEGKKTIVVQKFLDKSSTEEQEKFVTFFGKNDIRIQDLEWYKQKIKEKKVIEEIQEEMQLQTEKLYSMLHERKEKYLVEITTEILHVLNDFTMVKV